ncbi:MAG: primosomal protein N' [Acidobacteria bacterium]|nr:primosomal protein N' [Acidobacteriota bacterium]
MSRYCDVALPVPLDQSFTYELVETLRHRVRPGARVLAPFGPRKLTGVVVRCHDEPPEQQARQIIRLLDEEPALSEELLRLGRWVADYYCAPIGETLKTMLPLGVEVKETKVVRLTPRGAEAAAQFSAAVSADDPVVRVLRALEHKSLNLPYFKRKFPDSASVLRSLERKGYLTVAVEVEERDPLRARDGRLMVSAGDPSKAPSKPTKGERWLLDYLAAHPGEHDIEPLAVERKDVSRVAKKLERSGAVVMRVERKPVAKASADRQVVLNASQQRAYDAVAASIHSGAYKAFLLHGVTGSGKTEVYLRSIDAALEAGKSAMLLVPEIALTPQVASQFFARFGDRVAILHSAFTGWQRSEQWRRIRSGEARVVVGTRSGVFAPVTNLGLVIVDEEHESSYKQEETPRYHGRNVAIVRAAEAGATVLLGSATPSLESRYNVELGKYELLEMPERIAQRPMPVVEVVDMRDEFVETRRNDMFSRALLDELEQKLGAGEQTMVLLNRRGFSMYVMCRKCGERVQCENCSVTLTYHKREHRLLCHYCDYAAPVPSKCPACSSEYMHFQGSGSEKVEDELRRLFAKARIARLDRDTVKGRDHYETVLQAFREHRYDILVGTQMIAKGHDIPNVTLVGVVSADVGLGIPDFRAAERTFQLLTQVAGRAGRGVLPGKVVMQTYEPGHYAIRFAAKQDYKTFYEKEMYYRRQMHYPPFAALAMMMVRSQKLEESLAWSGRLGRHLQDLPDGVYMQGPAAASVHKLKTEYRYQFLLKARNRSVLNQALRKARAYAQGEGWPPTALILDVDPMSLL